MRLPCYRVKMPDSININFETIIQKVIQLKNDESRTVDIRGVPIRLHEIYHQWGECWEGDIIRIRMTEVPVKASRRGAISAFGLSEDEGMGEQSAFLYHPQTRVLMLQSSKFGISVSDFARYFEELGNLNQSIFVDPVIPMDALKNLNKIQEIRKFEVRAAGLENMQLLNGQDYGVQEMTRLSETFHAPQMQVSLSVGHSKNKSLSLERAKETAFALLRISTQNKKKVSKIRISGSTEDNELASLDLLQNRLRDDIEIIPDPGRSRNVAYGKRQEAIRKAWELRQNELISMFIPPNN